MEIEKIIKNFIKVVEKQNEQYDEIINKARIIYNDLSASQRAFSKKGMKLRKIIRIVQCKKNKNDKWLKEIKSTLNYEQ